MKTRAYGYTLLEAAIVVVVVGLLATLALNGYGRLKSRTQFSTAANQLMAELSTTRARARSEEQPVVVVFLASSTKAAPARYVIFQDINRTFDISTFQPSSLPAGAKLISDVTLPDNAVTVDTSTRARPALPAPFSAVETTGGITFARATYGAPYDVRGAITFQTDGRATFSDLATTGSIYISDAQSTARSMTIAIIGATGAVKGF